MKKYIPPYCNCAYCDDTGWVCENHFWREAHTCECGVAGKPCKCNKAKPPWNFKPKKDYERREGWKEKNGINYVLRLQNNTLNILKILLKLLVREEIAKILFAELPDKRHEFCDYLAGRIVTLFPEMMSETCGISVKDNSRTYGCPHCGRPIRKQEMMGEEEIFNIIRSVEMLSEEFTIEYYHRLASALANKIPKRDLCECPDPFVIAAKDYHKEEVAYCDKCGKPILENNDTKIYCNCNCSCYGQQCMHCGKYKKPEKKECYPNCDWIKCGYSEYFGCKNKNYCPKLKSSTKELTIEQKLERARENVNKPSTSEIEPTNPFRTKPPSTFSEVHYALCSLADKIDELVRAINEGRGK